MKYPFLFNKKAVEYLLDNYSFKFVTRYYIPVDIRYFYWIRTCLVYDQFLSLLL